MKCVMTQPERPFAATRHFVTSLLDSLQKERAHALSCLPPFHRGPAFEKAAPLFLRRIRNIERKARPQFFAAGRLISALHGKGWQSESEIVSLQMSLCACCEQTSHHTQKPVAASLVSQDNLLLNIAANQLAPGIPFLGRYIPKGTRRDQILCAEQFLLMDERGLFPVYAGPRDPHRTRDRAVKEAVRQRRQAVQTPPAKPLQRFKDATLIVSNVSCFPCSTAAVANGVETILVDTTKAAKFNHARQLSMEEGLCALACGNVRVLRFDPRTLTLS